MAECSDYPLRITINNSLQFSAFNCIISSLFRGNNYDELINFLSKALMFYYKFNESE